jgi:hypothetical protein
MWSNISFKQPRAHAPGCPSHRGQGSVHRAELL